MNWYLKAIKNYCEFSGRATRQEYWMFVLFNFIFSLIAAIIDVFIGIEIFSTLYSLFVLVPGLGIQFRRLHDIDKSGWWMLISLIPIVGVIMLIVYYAKPGTMGENRYGSDPKETVFE